MCSEHNNHWLFTLTWLTRSSGMLPLPGILRVLYQISLEKIWKRSENFNILSVVSTECISLLHHPKVKKSKSYHCKSRIVWIFVGKKKKVCWKEKKDIYVKVIDEFRIWFSVQRTLKYLFLKHKQQDTTCNFKCFQSHTI